MFFQESRRAQVKNGNGDEKTPDPTPLIDEINTLLSIEFIKGSAYASVHKRIKDLVFLRSVNTLPDSPFIATTGPKNAGDLCRFLTDILSCPPQLTIVALGDRLSETECSADKSMDFMNYYLRNYKVGPYQVAHHMLDGHFQYRDPISRPVIFAESELTISSGNERKKVRVVGLQLEDGGVIDLEHDPSSQKKEIIWQLFYRSWQDAMLVHCKHGHGRTGHLILTLELLRHFDEVFCHDDPKIMAEKVFNLLSAMRRQRPGLVHGVKQLTEAVRNAVIVYHYALQQGYILVNREEKLPDKSGVSAVAAI